MASIGALEARIGNGKGNGRPPCFLVKNKDYLGFLRVQTIDWVRAEGNYTCIHAGKAEYLVRRGIGEMEAQLDHGRFLRISRSVIVNLDRIERLVPWFSGGYLVRLSSGGEFKLTRRYAHKLFGLMGQPL
jgi:two-component system LytT family response regulator